MRYGVPYQGSKNQIAEQIVAALPKAHTLVDLFAGGAAITHRAIYAHKFREYIANDIDGRGLRLFKDAIEGKYQDERRWISRKDYKANAAKPAHDQDAWITLGWSFGCTLDENYAYAVEIEPWKRALHHAVVFDDYTALETFGIAMPRFPFPQDDLWTINKRANAIAGWIEENGATVKAKYTRWWCEQCDHKKRQFEEILGHVIGNVGEELRGENERLRQILLDARDAAGVRNVDVDRHLGTSGMSGHYFGTSQWEFPTFEAYMKMREIMPTLPEDFFELTNYATILNSLGLLQNAKVSQKFERLENLTRLNGLNDLQGLRSFNDRKRLTGGARLKTSQVDYRAVDIPADSTVYCDIPYYLTKTYGQVFDHRAFWDWCEAAPHPVFVSEYWMPPDRFTPVLEIDKKAIFSSTSNSKTMVEKLYVQKTYADTFKRPQQMTIAPLLLGA